MKTLIRISCLVAVSFLLLPGHVIGKAPEKLPSFDLGFNADPAKEVKVYTGAFFVSDGGDVTIEGVPEVTYFYWFKKVEEKRQVIRTKSDEPFPTPDRKLSPDKNGRYVFPPEIFTDDTVNLFVTLDEKNYPILHFWIKDQGRLDLPAFPLYKMSRNITEQDYDGDEPVLVAENDPRVEIRKGEGGKWYHFLPRQTQEKNLYDMQ